MVSVAVRLALAALLLLVGCDAPPVKSGSVGAGSGPDTWADSPADAGSPPADAACLEGKVNPWPADGAACKPACDPPVTRDCALAGFGLCLASETCVCGPGGWQCSPCQGDKGALFCPCASSAECVDQLCAESPAGRLCVPYAIREIGAPGYRTVMVSGVQEDPVPYELPRHARLCAPCETSAGCAVLGVDSACVAHGAAGAYCASGCGLNSCPDTYGCADLVTVEGATYRGCVPKGHPDAACSCNPLARSLGLGTSCAVAGQGGEPCAGSRSCGPDGLTPCVADPGCGGP